MYNDTMENWHKNNPKPMSPCVKTCEERSAGCRDVCVKFIEYEAARIEYGKKKEKEIAVKNCVDSYYHERKQQIKRRMRDE